MTEIRPSASDHPATGRFGYALYHPPTRAAWRAWLDAHHADTRGVWALMWRSGAGRDAVPNEVMVEEALCVGWIDSTTKVFDDDRRLQLYTPRRPRSTWARTNKERVARLEAEGRMGPAGRRAIEVARANGSWDVLDDVEALREPDDLAAGLDAVPAARQAWDGFPPSAKRQMLQWLVTAVRDDTRQRRVHAIVTAAARGERAGG